jgi:hypothetical protein
MLWRLDMPHRATDIRFTAIEDAAGLLDTLPKAEQIVWPTDPGDLQAIEEALAKFAAKLPPVRASLRRHKRMMREQRGLRSVTTVR